MGNWKKRLPQGLLVVALMGSGMTEGWGATLGTVEVRGSADPSLARHLTSSQVNIILVSKGREEGKGLPDLLAETSGVQVKRFGGLESFSFISVRGTSPTQTRFYLDGVPLPQTATGVINLSTLPFSSLERIEVYKGAAPVGFGDSPIGGTVNLVTKKIPETRTIGGAVGYGSFNTLQAETHYGQPLGRSGFWLGAGYRGTSGDFSFSDDNGTPFNRNDDEVVPRQNNDSREVSLSGRYGQKKEWGEIDLFSDFFLRHQGVPGLGNFQSTTARLDSWRHHFRGEYRQAWGSVRSESRLFSSLEEDSFRDLNGEVGLARQHNKDRSWSGGGEEFFSAVWKRHLLAMNFRVQEELFAPTDQLQGLDLPNHHRTSLQGGVEDEILLFHDHMSVVPSLRLEGNLEEEKFYYAPALRIRVAPLDLFYLKFGLSRGYRVPSFFELYGDRGSTAGNPNLLPETSFGVDGAAGVTLREKGRLKRLLFEVSPFYINARQLILFEQNSQRTVIARNTSMAEIIGLEEELSLEVTDHFRFHSNYTYQRAIDTSEIPFLNGNLLPARPVHEIYARPELFSKLPWGETTLFYEGNFIAKNFLDRANLNRLASRTIHNAGLTVRPRKEVTIVFEAKNITNNQIADAIGFPLPGRSYFGSIHINYQHKEEKHETQP